MERVKMWKIGSNGMKWLKILHIFLVVLFLGGILSSFALTVNLDLSNFEDVYLTYKSLGIISDHIVKVGAQGIILLGLIYGIFTRWGFIRYKWLATKWLLFIAQTFIGILVVDRLRSVNLALLDAGKIAAISDPVFIQNHSIRQAVVITQIIITLATLILSVSKPWENSKKT
jgi:hypothetical protein